jgi:DNA-binding response OmpR family regulator
MLPHVLLATGDTDLNDAVRWYLEAEGLRVEVVEDPRELLEVMSARRPEVVAVHLGAIEEGVREALAALPETGEPWLLALASRPFPAARQTLCPPVGALELAHALRDLLRRHRPARQVRAHPGLLHRDPDTGEFTVRGQPLLLAPAEARLLGFLLDHPLIPHPRSRLADILWGENYYGDLRLVDSHISHLRRKLAAAGLKPCPLITLRGTGYAYRPEDAADSAS